MNEDVLKWSEDLAALSRHQYELNRVKESLNKYNTETKLLVTEPDEFEPNPVLEVRLGRVHAKKAVELELEQVAAMMQNLAQKIHAKLGVDERA